MIPWISHKISGLCQF